MALARGEATASSPELKRVSTTPSAGQSEEATKRTEENEGDLLESIRAKNAKTRADMNVGGASAPNPMIPDEIKDKEAKDSLNNEKGE